MTSREIKKFALRLNIDTTRTKTIITRSMGNYKEICSFIAETPDSVRPLAISLLENLPDKDLRDTRRYVLSDHLINSKVKAKDEVETGSKFFLEYVLNPRIANELLVAWRHYFLTKLPPGLVKNGSGDALLIVQYLNDNIRIADDENYYGTPLTPIGVNELKVSDTRSRAIYFVAICRSLGIPAQKKPYRNKGYIKLQSSDKNPVPEYYIHFTLARFEGGRYNTLEYDFNRKITDFKEELPLPPGHYMLVTGNRLDNSKILSNISFFELLENEHRTVVVQIR